MATRTAARFLPSLAAPRRETILATLVHAFSVHRQRRRLAELPEHLLSDVGLTQEEARREAEKPIWDAPGHWRR